jgi:hypothetical protein
VEVYDSYVMYRIERSSYENRTVFSWVKMWSKMKNEAAFFIVLFHLKKFHFFISHFFVFSFFRFFRVPRREMKNNRSVQLLLLL